MLLSRKLFNEFFPNFKFIDNSKLETMLNAIGIEVESVYKFEETKNLVVGQIINVEKHPKSNKLNICKVNIGNDEIRTIICGAKNARKDIKVIVAKENAHLYDGRIIEEKEIVGVKSCGMICAYSELTSRIEFLPDDELDKIIELDKNAIIGDNNPLKYIGLDDEILDLSLPSNRNELNGIIGLGFDLLSVYYPNVILNYDFNFDKYKKNNIELDIDRNICDFFGTLKFSGFKSKKSSWKIKYYLMNSGLKPKNLLIDISNLNMVITGNPSHCYDSKKIGNSIEVKLNQNEIEFIALNDKECKVDKNDGIFVSSNNEPIALAGIIGTKDSSVKEDTFDVVFELANFNNLKIKKLSDKLNLKTDASILFSKKIPLWITLKSFETLIDLLEKSDANFEGISYTSFEITKNRIELNCNEIRNLLGEDLTDSKIIKYLKQLGFGIINKKIVVPPYREDIENISDVVEELVKKIDINNLPEKPIESTSVNFDFDLVEDNKEFLERYFLDKDFSLVKTLNLTSKIKNEKFNIFGTKEWVKILNPISNEREYFRNNLIEQHIEVLATNYSHKNNLYNIFEIQGLIYDNKWEQHLCLTFVKDLFVNKISNQKINNDLLMIKSLVSDISHYFGIEIQISENNNENKVLLKNNSIELYLNGEIIGYAGQINPEIINQYKLDKNNPIYFLELKIDNVLNSKNDSILLVSDQKTTHSIKKLLTATVNEPFSFKEIFSVFDNLEQEQIIKNIEIESVYKKENETSYTFSFDINESKMNDLNQSNINKVLEEMIQKLEEKNIIVRR